MAEESGRNFSGQISTLLAILLTAVLGVKVGTQSDSGASDGKLPEAASSDSASSETQRAKGWKVTDAASATDLLRIIKDEDPNAPEKHHPFLKPLAYFTGRSLDDFKYLPEEGRYVVDPPHYDGGTSNTPGDRVSLESFLKNYQADYLIAAIPDPDDSRQAYWSDLMLEALQRAVEASDPKRTGEEAYILDRYWLPWQHSGGEGAKDANLHRKFPGMLLFRSNTQTDHPHLLIVFLVGETLRSGFKTSDLIA